MAELSYYIGAKTKVYRFGAVWHLKCTRYGCFGGRERVWDKALTRAVEHARTHIQSYIPPEED